MKTIKATIKATGRAGKEYGHVPGHQYHDVGVTITRTHRGRWTAKILETWGSAQGYDEEHGRKQVIGRGDDLSDAIIDARERADRATIAEDHMGYLEQALSAAENEANSLMDAEVTSSPLADESTEALLAELVKRGVKVG